MITKRVAERILTVNRFILGASILSDDVLSVIRRELRKISDGVMVTQEEIAKVLSEEVLKRDIIEGEDATKAQNRIRRFYGKAIKRTKEKEAEKAEEQPHAPPRRKCHFPTVF